MRALPGVSLEYLSDTWLGKTAGPDAVAGAAGAAGVSVLVAFFAFGSAAGFASAAGGAVGAAAGVAAASEPHSDLRKSFHLAVFPAALAALYLSPHSFIVSALAGMPARY